MPPEILLELDQERREAELADQENEFYSGKTDAAFGCKPVYANEPYLMGYVAGIQELPRLADGRIDWSYHTQHQSDYGVFSPDEEF